MDMPPHNMSKEPLEGLDRALLLDPAHAEALHYSIHRIWRGYEGQVDLKITQELRLHAPFRILPDA